LWVQIVKEESKVEISGVSQFFYFAIPAVLALAAIWWLSFGQGLHYFRRALSQEKRHAEIVGAAVLPKAAMKIKIVDARDAAVRIDRAEIDGGDLWVYYKNVGHSRASDIGLTWRLIAPDGTVVKAHSGYVMIYSENNAPDSLEPGERGEAHYDIPSDPRAVTLELAMRH